MKAIVTLFLAVMACAYSFAQTDQQPHGQPPGRTHPPDHADSLVMIEAGIINSSITKTDPPDPAFSPADSIKVDSLARVDSFLNAHTKVLPFQEVIQAVLTDFPYNLRNITGVLQLAQGEFENYTSMVQLQEAQSCIVTRYHSVDDTTASWQAKISTSEEFGQASRVYKELYKKLEHCYVKLVDGSIIYLQGVWEPANEDAPFTTSTLRLTTGDWRYKEVKVELELVYLLSDWAVNLNIITKKRDDEVGGRE